MRTRTAAALVAALTLTVGALTAVPSSAAPSSAAPSAEGGVKIERGPGFTGAGDAGGAGGAVGKAAANVRGGSIVFIRGGNVWLVRGDGSGRYQVTKDGGYKWPSMSDNGTIVAEKGGVFVIMRQNGVVLRRLKPTALFVPEAGTAGISGPRSPMISPDAKRIAYSQYRARYVGSYLTTDHSTTVTSSTKPTISAINIGETPMFVTNNRILYTRESTVSLANVAATGASWYHSNHLGYGDDIYRPAMPDVSLSPNAKLTANHIDHVDGSALAIAAVTGNPRTSVPAAPSRVVCHVTPDASANAFSRATFSPDSKAIVFTEAGRLTVARNIDVCNATTSAKVLLSGVSDPYWSKAALNPPKRPGAKPGTPAKAKKLKVKKKPRVTGKARVGRKLKVSAGKWSPKPAKVAFRWYRGKKLVKGKAGAKRIYKLKKADKGKRLRVKVTVTRKGYAKKAVWSNKSKKVKRR